tara:strand:- start:7426 stop:8601 length:1176 start_codon:yes stop_codon:yes gene_type:complete
MFVGIFDPANKILGLKLPAFILCWLVFLIYYGSKPVKIVRDVYVYIFLMLFIPVLSMFYFEVFLGGGQTAALILIKAQLYVSLIYILVAAKIDIIPMLCRILCLLSWTIISVKVVVSIFPELMPAIQIFGSTYGILLIGDRSYGDSSVFEQIYFVTSPMLLIAIAYYSDRACKSGFFSWNSFFAFVSIVGMVLAGTRSNMIGPFIVLVFIMFLNTKNKVLFSTVVIFALLLFVSVFYSTIFEVLSLQEDSNSSKLKLLQDYADIFSDPTTLIFGQGFGSYYYWDIRGYYFTSELSYLELIRVYGLIFGTIMAGLILYPILFVMASKREFSNRASIIGFTAYMAIAAVNPLIFSSLGMTIISAFMANIFRSREFYVVFTPTKLSYNKSIGLA